MKNKIKKLLTKIFNNPIKEPEKKPLDADTILDFQDKIKKLSPFLSHFENHLILILHPQNDVNSFIKQAQGYTDNIEIEKGKKHQFINELWMIRYILLFNFFLNLIPPKDQNDLEDIVALLQSATKQALNKIGKTDYLPLFKQALLEYKFNQLTFNDFKNLNSLFARSLADKVPLIIFECTGGKLGGKQYDDIRELIYVLLETDKKVLETGEKFQLSEEEIKSIKKEIDQTKLTEEDAVEAMEEALSSLNKDKKELS